LFPWSPSGLAGRQGRRTLATRPVAPFGRFGVDRTRVELVVDPAARVNEHRIMVRGAFGELEIVLRNNPLATNPKSSELTALSLVRLIEQQGRTVVI